MSHSKSKNSEIFFLLEYIWRKKRNGCVAFQVCRPCLESCVCLLGNVLGNVVVVYFFLAVIGILFVLFVCVLYLVFSLSARPVCLSSQVLFYLFPSVCPCWYFFLYSFVFCLFLFFYFFFTASPPPARVVVVVFIVLGTFRFLSLVYVDCFSSFLYHFTSVSLPVIRCIVN